MKECCWNCKFFDGEDVGFCRRYPPRITVIQTMHSGYVEKSNFPEVYAGKFCGEWQPKNPAVNLIAAVGDAARDAGIFAYDPGHPLTADGAAMLAQEMARLLKAKRPA